MSAVVLIAHCKTCDARALVQPDQTVQAPCDCALRSPGAPWEIVEYVPFAIAKRAITAVQAEATRLHVESAASAGWPETNHLPDVEPSGIDYEAALRSLRAAWDAHMESCGQATVKFVVGSPEGITPSIHDPNMTAGLCSCAHVPPTMPTCRTEHLPGCLAVEKVRDQLTRRCGICGVEPGQTCVVVSGGPDEDPRLDGREPGEARAAPHFYR